MNSKRQLTPKAWGSDMRGEYDYYSDRDSDGEEDHAMFAAFWGKESGDEDEDFDDDYDEYDHMPTIDKKKNETDDKWLERVVKQFFHKTSPGIAINQVTKLCKNKKQNKDIRFKVLPAVVAVLPQSKTLEAGSSLISALANVSKDCIAKLTPTEMTAVLDFAFEFVLTHCIDNDDKKKSDSKKGKRNMKDSDDDEDEDDEDDDFDYWDDEGEDEDEEGGNTSYHVWMLISRIIYAGGDAACHLAWTRPKFKDAFALYMSDFWRMINGDRAYKYMYQVMNKILRLPTSFLRALPTAPSYDVQDIGFDAVIRLAGPLQHVIELPLNEDRSGSEECKAFHFFNRLVTMDFGNDALDTSDSRALYRPLSEKAAKSFKTQPFITKNERAMLLALDDGLIRDLFDYIGGYGGDDDFGGFGGFGDDFQTHSPSCKLLGAIFARFKNDLQLTTPTLSNTTKLKVIRLIDIALDHLANLDKDSEQREVLQMVLLNENILDTLHHIIKNGGSGDASLQKQRTAVLKAMETSFDTTTKQSVIAWKWKPDYINTLESIVKDANTLSQQAQKVLDLVNGIPQQQPKAAPKKKAATTKKK